MIQGRKEQRPTTICSASIFISLHPIGPQCQSCDLTAQRWVLHGSPLLIGVTVTLNDITGTR